MGCIITYKQKSSVEIDEYVRGESIALCYLLYIQSNFWYIAEFHRYHMDYLIVYVLNFSKEK